MVKKNIQRSKKYRKEADRKDQTDKLGKALSMTEMRTYLTIDLHGSNPIGTEEISETLRIPGEREYTENYVQVLIGRIREKLGDESIISYFGEGYTTRRAEIEDQVEKRIQ